ncbi:MAG: alkaline phosphatase, partial [Gemmatimonadaceae bacterium]|nr:alkaline phosphatase [Caulobacter sp.]
MALSPVVGGGVAFAADANAAKAPKKLSAAKKKAAAKKRLLAGRDKRCREAATKRKLSFPQYRACLKNGKPARQSDATRTITKTVEKIVEKQVPGPAAPPAAPGKKAKNIILMIGDGMGVTHIDAARQRYYGAAGQLNMEKFPTLGTVSTYAVEPGSAKPNYVTDSASAATAWSSGVKTYNAALGVDAKGSVVPTLMELAKQAGFRTGNVSTAEITDATPAGQMSHALARGCQGPVYSTKACQDLEITGEELPTSDVRVTPIADQIARNGTADVILGGGLGRFDASDETALKQQGYAVLGSVAGQVPATKTDLAAAGGKKVFGLFNKGNLTVEKTKQENPSAPEAQEPSLPEMTRKAISLLGDKSSKGKGFYLQIEGALIDKRSHANDAAQTLEEIKA